MSKNKMKYVNRALSVIIYVPLTLLGMYALVQLYDFIKPPSPTQTSKNDKAAEEPSALAEEAATQKSKIKHIMEIYIKPVLEAIKSAFIFIKNLLGNNLFKIPVILFLIAYFISFYYFTFLYRSNETLKKYSFITNTIFILLGAFMSIGAFSLFVKENRDEQPYPSGFFKKFSWMWRESESTYKNILGMAITLALIVFSLYLINRFSFLSLTLTIIIQIVAIIALFFGIFFYISGKKKWMTKIQDIPLFKFLYHFIFVIPCSILSLTNFIWQQIRETPWIVYIILLVEIIVIALYFLIPMLIKYLYVSGSKKDLATIEQTTAGNDTSLLNVENRMANIMGGLDVDWDKIIEKQWYKQEMVDPLKDYLKKQGYESTDKLYRKTSFWKKMFTKSLSLEAAVSYVQANAPVLIELYDDAEVLENKSKALSKIAAKQSALFKTTILLNKAVYTDSIKDIGSYENLGGDANMYNYNYGLSSWFFIHEQPPSARAANNKFTSILNYGNKPNILFKVNEHKLQIRMNSGIDKEKIIFETTDFPLQVWNNIVINYNGGTLDIFINGKLVSSTNNIVPYMAYDKITVGEDDGVSGGACNITYFSSPLTLRKISLFYNMLKNKNPPII